MKLLILSMASDGEILFRVNNKYEYIAWIDTAHYPFIRKWAYRKPGLVLNMIKARGKVKRVRKW